jgi:type I restriction enzyme S subunit
MKASELRQSILQAAVQGKLVPQELHDEPASTLLERIRDGKIKLIKQDRIKKDKSLPPINKDEIPYDLPDGWVWCRLEEVTIFVATGPFGSMLHKSDYVNAGIPVVNPANIQNGSIVPSDKMLVDELTRDRLRSYILHEDDIVVARRGDLGRCAIVSKMEEGWLCGTGSFFLHLNESLFRPYFLLFFQSPPCKKQLLSESVGSTMNNLNHSILKNIYFPLPPLAEQQRIVAKVDELMSLCDQLLAAEDALENLEEHFIECLPKSILQMAVQGKLLPQELHDEPASALLERIRAEKAKLIKQGKIKKEKPLPPISQDEIPYDLPDGWTWSRLNDICTYIQRGKSSKYSDVPNIPVLSQKCVQWSGIDMTKGRFISPGSISTYSLERFLQNEDILWNSTGQGTLGRVALFHHEKKFKQCVVDSHITIVRVSKPHVLPEYVFLFLASPLVQDFIEEKSTGTTKQIELGTETIKMHLIPIPPLLEQQRIVAKINELMLLCDELSDIEYSAVQTKAGNVIHLIPGTEQNDKLGIAARGDATQAFSPKLQGAIAKLRKDKTHD